VKLALAALSLGQAGHDVFQQIHGNNPSNFIFRLWREFCVGSRFELERRSVLKSLFHTGHGRLEDKANSFTALRILFAVIILAGHSIQIRHGLPFTQNWPLFLDFLVQRCLDGFFILSGYMITASALRSRDVLGYTLSRALRIFPGLVVTVLILWLVVGPLFTSMPMGEYWTQTETWAFPALLISQADPLAGLPGVFEASPMGDYANGPLWTIRYELMAYLGVGLLMAMGLYRRRAQVLLWTLMAAGGAVAFEAFGYTGVGEATIGSLSRFAPAFLIGASFYAARDQVSLSPGFVALSLVAALAADGTVLGPLMLQVATAWTVLWLGFLALPGRTGAAIRNVEDVSYGVYILHWPLGMMAFAMVPGLSSLVLFAIMVPTAVLAGWTLRVAVEKPAMAMKRGLRATLSGMPPVAAE
jgi:peptidoglycan/LPS O-acetylase OafA/YrhL